MGKEILSFWLSKMPNFPWSSTGDTTIATASFEVIFDYSPETHDLTTLSLHHFEDDEMLGGYVHNEWVPSVRVDPENRCLPS